MLFFFGGVTEEGWKDKCEHTSLFARVSRSTACLALGTEEWSAFYAESLWAPSCDPSKSGEVRESQHSSCTLQPRARSLRAFTVWPLTDWRLSSSARSPSLQTIVFKKSGTCFKNLSLRSGPPPPNPHRRRLNNSHFLNVLRTLLWNYNGHAASESPLGKLQRRISSTPALLFYRKPFWSNSVHCALTFLGPWGPNSTSGISCSAFTPAGCSKGSMIHFSWSGTWWSSALISLRFLPFCSRAHSSQSVHSERINH